MLLGRHRPRKIEKLEKNDAETLTHGVRGYVRFERIRGDFKKDHFETHPPMRYWWDSFVPEADTAAVINEAKAYLQTVFQEYMKD